MLRKIIYFNIIYLLIISIYFVIISKSKKNIKKRKEVLVVFIIYNIFSLIICNSEIVELDWMLLLTNTINIVSLILNIIALCITNKTINNKKTIKKSKSLLFLIIEIIPFILFVFAYSFELYVINKCDYLLKYNYQNGIIISEDMYIAIIKNKPVTVTLEKNIFDRKGKSSRVKKYEVIYNDKVEISTRDSNYEKEIIDSKIIKEIALDSKEKCKDAKSALITYLPEEEYAIVELLSDEGSGTLIGEYFYHNEKYIKNIRTNGDLESIIYYE